LKPFSYIYLFVAAILLIVATPILLLVSFKKKYRDSIPARFFLWKNPPFEKEGIWFHVCSFGEVRSIKPLIDDLSLPVNISVITNTGYKEAEAVSENVRFLPYELWLPWWVRKQKLLVVSEAELWYMLFLSAKMKGTRTIFINARISDHSYQNYKRFAFFYKRIFENIDEVYAQSQKDKERLEELGAKNITVCGNIKAYGKVAVSKQYPKPSQNVLTLASTHEGEEKMILDRIVIKDGMKIIVVPRHPERFDEVAHTLREFANKKHISFGRFSEIESFEKDITLVDKMGELVNIYAISDIVLLGGSFVDGVGGHNPLEPAHFKTKIISGPYYFNQKALYELVENIEIVDIDDLPHALSIVQASKANLKVDIKPIKEALDVV